MNIKNDDSLFYLRNFGFTCQERSVEGFLRYNKRIGNMLVTVANGQFENKIRVSLLRDKDGSIKTSYHDILAYTELIGALSEAGLLNLQPVSFQEDTVDTLLQSDVPDEYEALDSLENPLMAFPLKPEGFMAL